MTILIVSQVESEDGVCVLCEFVVEVAEDKLLTNRTFDMTKRAVQMICSYMPQSIAEKCEDFVDEYGDQLIHLIVEEELQPKDFCTQMNACKQEKALLGQGEPLETLA